MGLHLFKVLFLLSISATAVFACSCYLPPGQTDNQRFCSYNLEFLAFVFDPIIQDDTNNKQYPAFVFHIARDKDNKLSPSLHTTINITTARDEGVCGVTLTPLTSYLISSNSDYDQETAPYVTTSLCDWNVRATSLDSLQIVGLFTWTCPT